MRYDDQKMGTTVRPSMLGFVGGDEPVDTEENLEAWAKENYDRPVVITDSVSVAYTAGTGNKLWALLPEEKDARIEIVTDNEYRNRRP